MSLLDLHEDDLISAAEAAPPVAPRKQDPKFSTWATVKGAVKAVPAAVAELAGSASDILGAYGGVSAATGASAGGMFSTGTDAERKQTTDAAKKLREQGPDYRSEAGASFRQVAKDYMPDAKTAHGAEVAVAEFGRLATKAIVGGVALGPLAGALAAGAEEGFTASDKLADQGVDVNTRTQVGAVTAAVTAAGFALPVAGKTVAKTVGLALAGGPVSFIGQNAATREILANADYSTLADQYDPFDPVGLTLSTLVPLGFGAMAMRGAARKAAGAPQTAPEVVDAARVQLLRENVDAHRATPPEDFAAAQAHEAAVGKAIDQMASGQRVEVAQALEPSVPVAEWAGRDTVPVGSWVKSDFKLADSQPVYQVREIQISDLYLPELETDGRLAPEKRKYLEPYTERAKAGEVPPGISVIEMEDGRLRVVDGHRRTLAAQAAGKKTIRALVSPLIDTPQGKQEATAENIGPLVQITQTMADRMAPVGRELEALRLMDSEPEPVTAPTTAQPAAAASDAAQATPAAGIDPAATAREAARILSEGTPEDLGALVDNTLQRLQPERAPDAGTSTASPLQARIDAEIVGNPAALETKLPTAFDDAGNVTDSVTVREYLDTIKAEAEQEAADANLLQVAANCFLMNGA
jgi:hypothetical protein